MPTPTLGKTLPASADMPNDQLVISADAGSVLPNVGVGIYYYYDKFYLGFSAPQLIPLRVKFADDVSTSTINKVNHYFLVIGGKIPLGAKVPKGQYNKFYIEPMAWFKSVRNAPYQYDIYARFRYKNTVWVGAGYRSSKTIVADAGVLINDQIGLGYAYDVQVAGLNPYLGGTHAVILSYHLLDKSKKRRY